MTPKEIKVVFARINEELQSISTLMDELENKSIYKNIDGFMGDSFYLRSIGSVLHDFYYDIPEVRPAVISKTTMDKLDKYRAFRHIFRNVYGYNLDSDRIKELLLELPETVDLFTDDVKSFMNLLEQ